MSLYHCSNLGVEKPLNIGYNNNADIFKALRVKIRESAGLISIINIGIAQRVVAINKSPRVA